MSLDVWLSRGKKVNIGGRDLIMMPLPLSKLVAIGNWLEETCNDVVADILGEIRKGKEAPNPLALVTKVLLRIDMSQTALIIFESPKDPLTRSPVNKDLTREFFEEYLDIPTSKDLFLKFIEINQIEDLIKNLQSLPMAKKLIEIWTLTFGIPYLSSLQQSMVSPQDKLEGSLSHKSTDTLTPATSEELGLGSMENRNLTEEAKKPVVH
jgi:hypothetical protein